MEVTLLVVCSLLCLVSFGAVIRQYPGKDKTLTNHDPNGVISGEASKAVFKERMKFPGEGILEVTEADNAKSLISYTTGLASIVYSTDLESRHAWFRAPRSDTPEQTRLSMKQF